MLQNIIAFFRGSIAVEVRGAAVERFLNICSHKGVVFKEVRRLDIDKVVLTVGIEGYFTMRGCAKRAMCRLRVVKKRGMPFKAQKMEKRGALIACLAASALLVWHLSGFVWTIGITGDCPISQVELLQLLQQCGLETGARTSQISSRRISNDVMMLTDKLSFIAVNLKGTHAEVVVAPREEPPVEVGQRDPCDVISDGTGIIIALRVKTGSARVKVGETLMPGDLIVSGAMVSTQGQQWLVHAEAEADVRTWLAGRRRVVDTVMETVETGRRTARRYLVVGSRRISINLIESEPYACYYKEVEKRRLTLGGDFRYPVMLVTETYIEVETRECPLDPDKVRALLQDSMGQSLAAANPGAKVISSTFDFGRANGAFQGVMRTECVKTVGAKRPIAPQ